MSKRTVEVELSTSGLGPDGKPQRVPLFVGGDGAVAVAPPPSLEPELEGEHMLINIGPQHPATHGTLRLVVRLDGERVIAADPIIGYMHRGYEKLAEVRTYPQVTTLVNRIDWLGSFANEVPFILAAEKLMGIEAPARAQWIRTILFELSRIANVSLFLGDLGVQLGAITPVFMANTNSIDNRSVLIELAPIYIHQIRSCRLIASSKRERMALG